MEYADGGDLFNRIKKYSSTGSKFPEEEIWKLLYEMTSGLKALHDLKICHRDIKCANMFISKGKIKIGDLNVSKIVKVGLLYTQTGTPYYASPEVWKDRPYDFKSDIWSLGCVLYEMCALRPPFMAGSMRELYKKVTLGIYPEIPSCYSEELAEVVHHLLQVIPGRRPTCAQILSMPSVRKYSEDVQAVKTADNALASGKLLGTIRLPKNLRSLGERLPQSNYDIRPFHSIEVSRSKLSRNPSCRSINGALESIPELTKATESFEESKAEQKHSAKGGHRRRRPRVVYSREDVGSSELPSIAGRKCSEERRKRLQDLKELQEKIIVKYLPKKSPSGIDYLHRKPPRPIILNNEVKRYHAPNPMRQAGLAVIESPQNYIPIRPMRNRLLL
eukprot:TRINITY_DN1781_c0_g1_i2.p1 TRINITY_DN1781_c0_g1~~TRINITY_DN1781_c0_g1_i2.p1  ORF type:complete len:389 (-),score=85.00 TRINITY_DN1781_c0_g1_i2:121-1287(-)